MSEVNLINRNIKLLRGHEPEEWPVPVNKEDLRQLLGNYIANSNELGQLEKYYYCFKIPLAKEYTR